MLTQEQQKVVVQAQVNAKRKAHAIDVMALSRYNLGKMLLNLK
ncbi:hypothetical protein [Serratia sp. Se-RSBMAAmG]|nr:hypothetical protein [Serratia sp. Se-RSBMAAmG]MDI6976075.1 hypothetical protein [Serratia sp. Se-RSBMAAmG]